MHNNNNNKKRHHYNNGKNRNRQRFQNEKPSINKVYDSNGPTGRQRGNASTLYEKYVNLARDASASGDRVLSENLMQHAEHYLRIVHLIQEQMQASYRDNIQKDNSSEDTMPSSLNITSNEEGISNISDNIPQESDGEEESQIKEKAPVRRKVYPFARRKSTENNVAIKNVSTDEAQFKESTQEALSNDSIKGINTKISTDTKVSSDSSKVSKSSENIPETEKPRRVVRKRASVIKSDKSESAKNQSSDSAI